MRARRIDAKKWCADEKQGRRIIRPHSPNGARGVLMRAGVVLFPAHRYGPLEREPTSRNPSDSPLWSFSAVSSCVERYLQPNRMPVGRPHESRSQEEANRLVLPRVRSRTWYRHSSSAMITLAHFEWRVRTHTAPSSVPLPCLLHPLTAWIDYRVSRSVCRLRCVLLVA